MRLFRFFTLIVVLFIVLFGLCGCGVFSEQQYTCEIDAVASVKIVILGEMLVGEERHYDYTVLREVSDYRTFIQQLTEIKHRVNWGDPYVLDSGYTVIRIEYQNGDYDLIYHNTQANYRSGKWKTGYFCFDQEQFNSLLSNSQSSDTIKTGDGSLS